LPRHEVVERGVDQLGEGGAEDLERRGVEPDDPPPVVEQDDPKGHAVEDGPPLVGDER